MPEKNSISAVNLPIVDYGNVVDTNVESRRNEATKLVDAFTNFGFAMVENIDGYNEEELLEAIKWFYYDVTPQVMIASYIFTKNAKLFQTLKSTYSSFLTLVVCSF